ncbi:hypothetical protein P3T76_008687 [Phytophthora citrophthora]|uniref:Uncharacterized protein n=1 Tax=Phytophthora citrophthora TaxID=4793 RepID=A0AAD9GJD9_9STRA|nr:hypothetical protein P3T76_008687 [Phytophthora citrophthora]
MAGSGREPSPDADSKQLSIKCGPNANCQCQPSAAETREFRKVSTTSRRGDGHHEAVEANNDVLVLL